MFRPLDRLFPSHAAETTALTMATAATAATASLCYPRASDPGDLSTRSPTRDPLGAPPAPVTGFGVGDPLTTGLLGPGQALLNHMLFPLSSGLPHPLPFPLHLPLPLPLSIPPLPFPLPMPLSLGHHSGLQTAHNSPPGHTDRPAWQPTMSEASRGVGATTTPIHFDDAVETTEACRHSISPSLFCALSAASPSSPLPPPPRATFAQATSLSTIFASRANLTPSTPPLSVWSPFAAGRLDCPPSSGSPGPATPRPFYALPPDELEPVVMRTASPSLYCRDDPKPNFSYIGLIAKAILSTKERRMVLSDIYHWIQVNYAYFRTRGPGWRNSIRHNLSLNDCFIKVGRSANGKGHYWGIHSANLEDFLRGDFRRRRAQRKVRRALGLACPDDDDSDSGVSPASTTPPVGIPSRQISGSPITFHCRPQTQPPVAPQFVPVTRFSHSLSPVPLTGTAPCDAIPLDEATRRGTIEPTPAQRRQTAWQPEEEVNSAMRRSSTPLGPSQAFTVASLLESPESSWRNDSDRQSASRCQRRSIESPRPEDAPPSLPLAGLLSEWPASADLVAWALAMLTGLMGGAAVETTNCPVDNDMMLSSSSSASSVESGRTVAPGRVATPGYIGESRENEDSQTVGGWTKWPAIPAVWPLESEVGRPDLKTELLEAEWSMRLANS